MIAVEDEKLKQHLAMMRRQAEEQTADWEPSEVRFREDLRKMRQRKTETATAT